MFPTSLAFSASPVPISFNTPHSGHIKKLDIRIPRPRMSYSQKEELHISKPLKVIKLNVKGRSK